MSKSKELIKNTGILAVGNFSSKILTFLLVPLYTAILTTGEYGSYDIVYSGISLLIPILTLNISDAVLRFPLDDDADVPAIAKIGIGVTLLSGIVVFFLQLLFAGYFSDIAGFEFLSPFYISVAVYQLLLLFARGTENMIDVAVAGVISAVLTILLCFIFLVIFRWGLNGFFLSNIIGQLIPAVYLLVRLRKFIFRQSNTADFRLLKRMIHYALPLSMTVIGWWFINSSGRFIVTNICGIDANGLYSIAFKIPSILNVIATIFLQAWQVSAIKEFNAEDEDGFLARTYNSVEATLTLVCSILIVLSPFLAKILYLDEFYQAWHYVPALIVLALQNTMSGMWGPFFSANYDTFPMAISTVLGAIVNVVLGVPLTFLFGIWGMVAANLIAGFINWLYRGCKVRKHVEIDFHLLRSFVLSIVLLFEGFALVNPFLSFEVREGCAIFLTALIFFFFRKEIMRGLHVVIESIKTRS